MDIRPRGWSSGGWGPPRRSMERRTILSSSRAIAASDRCAIPGLHLAQRSTSRPCSSTSSSVRTPRHQPETAQRSRRCSSSLIFGASTKASVRPPAPLRGGPAPGGDPGPAGTLAPTAARRSCGSLLSPPPASQRTPGPLARGFGGATLRPPHPLFAVVCPNRCPGSGPRARGWVFFFGLQPCNRPPFFGGCPEASAARTGARWGARRGAKEC